MKKIIIVTLLIMYGGLIYAQNLRVTASGNVDFGQGLSMLNEAGSDFASELQSTSTFSLNVVYFYNYWFVYNIWPDIPWKLTVEMSGASTWDNNVLQLEMRRNINSGDLIYASAAQPKYLTGYESYEKLDEGINSEIYGRHGIQNIEFDFRLRGASVVLGAGDFETTLLFTVHDR